MTRTCGGNIVKLVLISINVLFLILGSVFIYIGFNLVKFDTQSFKLTDINFNSISYVIIAIGFVTILIAALGFFGSCLESSCMLNLYGVLLIALICAEIYTVVKSSKDITKEIQNGIKKAINEMDENNKTKQILQEIQNKLECCGWDGKSDYPHGKVLSSCCNKYHNNHNNVQYCNDNDNIYDGCKTKFESLSSQLGSAKGIGIVIIMAQLILIFAAFCLARDF